MKSLFERLNRTRLFSSSPEKGFGLPFWAWNWGILLLSGICISILSVLLGIGGYDVQIALDLFRSPKLMLLNTAPVLVLEALLYLIIGRAWIAFLASGALILAASVGDYFKIVFRDDPFMASDLSDLAIAMKFSGQYAITLNLKLLLCIAGLVLGTLFLLFLVRGRIRKLPGLIAAAVLVAACIPFAGRYTNENLYQYGTDNYAHVSRWSTTQNYLCKGFVYPFLHSLSAAFPEKPDGYSEKAALELLSAYEDADIPEDRKVNVIAIQLEAFKDLNTMGIEGISEEAYANFYALKEESLSGRLLTNVFAGGTVNTERSFLTGDLSVISFRSDTGSYVRYLKDQGYRVTGSHPCYKWFYNRENVNSYIGFDDYWFFENRYTYLTGDLFSRDDVLLPDVLWLYRQRDPSVPYFDFVVTYQGHGPYETNRVTRERTYWDGERSLDSTYYILNNYLSSVHSTMDNLKNLVEELRYEAEPVVLVVYGDHSPWLGDSNSAYNDLGVNLDVKTEEGFYNYYATEYLIWANDSAVERLGDRFHGTGPDVSASFLMNVLFDCCGWGGGSAWMQMTEELMDTGVTAVCSTGWRLQNGVLSGVVSEDAQAIIDRLKIAQYYRRKNAMS